MTAASDWQATGWKSATQEQQGNRAARWMFGSVAGASKLSGRVFERLDVRIRRWLDGRCGATTVGEATRWTRTMDLLAITVSSRVLLVVQGQHRVQQAPPRPGLSIAQASGQRVVGCGGWEWNWIGCGCRCGTIKDSRLEGGASMST